MKQVLLSWSSGKDSAWTLHELRRDPDVSVGALLTTINEQANRVAMHAVRLELLQAQAEAAGVPLWIVPLPHPCPNDAYEMLMAEAVRKAVALGFTHAAFGDLFLEDVRAYRERNLAGTGLTPLFPLWHRPTATLARDMVVGGLDARITCLNPNSLPVSFAGSRFDFEFLDSIPGDVDACGERGEFHTFACAGPMFSRPIAVRAGEIVQRDGFVFADLLPELP